MRCRAWERLSDIERFSIRGQPNACGFSPYYVALKTEVDCIIDIEYSGQPIQ